jgi:hypothetical protein
MSATILLVLNIFKQYKMNVFVCSPQKVPQIANPQIFGLNFFVIFGFTIFTFTIYDHYIQI